MKLAEAKYDNAETGCCAKLDAELWDGRRLEWNEKPFLKDHICSLLHVPLNFGSVIGRAAARAGRRWVDGLARRRAYVLRAAKKPKWPSSCDASTCSPEASSAWANRA